LRQGKGGANELSVPYARMIWIRFDELMLCNSQPYEFSILRHSDGQFLDNAENSNLQGGRTEHKKAAHQERLLGIH